MPSGTSTAHTAAAAMTSGRSQRRSYCGSQWRTGSDGGSSRYQVTNRLATLTSSSSVCGWGPPQAALYVLPPSLLLRWRAC